MTDATTPHEFTMVTQNIFGVPFVLKTRARLATIAHELNKAPLDIICLQEVQMTRYIRLLTRALHHFPYVVYEPFHYAPKGGLLTLSRHRLNSCTFMLYDQRGWWHTPSLADWMLHKGALVTRLHVGRTPVVVINTHLIANYDGDWSPGNRYARQQAAEVRQLAALVQQQPAEALVIVAGDFNFPHHSWLHREFTGTTGAFDALGDERHPTFRSPIPLAKFFAEAIDHVFIRPPAGHRVVVRADLLFAEKQRLVTGHHSFLSDHIGIQARLRWVPQGVEVEQPGAFDGSAGAATLGG